MPVLRIPTLMRTYTEGKNEVPVRGKTVAEAMNNLILQYPALRPHLYDREGVLRPFVNLFRGESNIKDLQGLDTPLDEDDRLVLIPSISGG